MIRLDVVLALLFVKFFHTIGYVSLTFADLHSLHIFKTCYEGGQC